MSPYRILFALLAFLGLVAVVPIWMHFTGATYLSGLPVEVQFLANMTLPVLAALLLASWLDPGGT